MLPPSMHLHLLLLLGCMLDYFIAIFFQVIIRQAPNFGYNIVCSNNNTGLYSDITRQN